MYEREVRKIMRLYQQHNYALDNASLMLGETLFHNANGYIGVRGTFEEGYPEGFNTVRGQYINGFYDFVEMPQAEKLFGLIEEKQTIVNVVDTQTIKLYIDGKEVSMFVGTVEESVRTLDMDRGITIREFTWCAPCGKRLKIVSKRMTSFENLALFLIDYEVTALNFSGEITFKSVHKGNVKNYFDPNDPRVAGEENNHLIHISSKVDKQAFGDCSYITAHTATSNLTVTTAVHNVIHQDATRSFTVSDVEVTEEITTYAKEGETVRLLKYSVICDDVRYGTDTELAAQTQLQEVVTAGSDYYYEKQASYLEKFWDSCDVSIAGDQELGEAVRYNLYQLVQSVGKDPHSNIAAKGLSGEGYEGHYFWDTEMYLQPFFTLTTRDIAKNLIRFRHTILDYAKENARILGHKKGAAFPWRTIMGKECSGFFPAGSAQYHISGDIVYSIIKYYLTTKELDIIEECGAEVMIEVSRMWMDLGNYYKGTFRLNEVTGPDEYTCLVNNNYYTNVLVKFGFYWTVKLIELLRKEGRADEVVAKTGLTQTELDEFIDASDKMYLPYDEDTGINPQDDSFLQKKVWDVSTIKDEERPLLLHYHTMHLYRYQVTKQADTVLAHFILEDMQDIDTIRKSFEYYEKVTTHDSSLSTCIYSIVAAKLGLMDKAYEYFGESAKLDLFNTHKNTKDGIHTANMGGTYMAIVYGFGGLRIKEDGLYLNPSLPKQWNEYTFRFLYEDAKFLVEVSREEVKISILEGSAKSIHVFGQEICVNDHIVLPMPR